jgi:hypothetical protein
MEYNFKMWSGSATFPFTIGTGSVAPKYDTVGTAPKYDTVGTALKYDTKCNQICVV